MFTKDKQTDPASREEAQHIFANIAAAYEILSDEDERASYDELQKEQTKKTGKAQGFDQKKANKAVRFNDPYEVFKRSFEEQFGVAYPGAKYDFIEDPNAKNGSTGQRQQSFAKLPQSSKNANNNNSSTRDDNGGKSGNRGILSRLRGGKKNNKDSRELVVHGSSNNNNNNSKKNKKNSKELVAKGNDDRVVQYDPSNRDPRDNRPVSMETLTKHIKHDDGTIETVTEMKITRPDGSTETFRSTDKAHKQPGWSGKSPEKKEQDKKLALQNGNPTRKQLTNGPGVSPTNKKGPFQIKSPNGGELEGPDVSTPPKTRRLIQWGGKKDKK